MVRSSHTGFCTRRQEAQGGCFLFPSHSQISCHLNLSSPCRIFIYMLLSQNVAAAVVNVLLPQNAADLGQSHSLALIESTDCMLRGVTDTSSLLHLLGNEGRSLLMHTISRMSSYEGSLGTRSWYGSWYSSTIPERSN